MVGPKDKVRSVNEKKRFWRFCHMHSVEERWEIGVLSLSVGVNRPSAGFFWAFFFRESTLECGQCLLSN